MDEAFSICNTRYPSSAVRYLATSSQEQTHIALGNFPSAISLYFRECALMLLGSKSCKIFLVILKGDLAMSTVSSIASMKEPVFKALIKRQPLLSMYIILFLLGWSGLILQVLDSQGVLSMPSAVALIVQILTGWAPGIAAVLVTAVPAGRAGVRDLLRRFLIWRVDLQWYVIALFLIAAIILGGIGLHILFGGAMPVIPAAGSSSVNTTIVFVVFIVLGALLNTEEIAWRGFALPRLQARYGVLAAGLLLAIPEVALHLPLFLDKTNLFFQTVGIYWFSVFSIAMVFIYIFVFNKTGGSI